ncbi:glycosyltransferase family 4 protein [Solihabitans fulvus]|uniref:Glycosyltransferase family 4 protein n=1 Tax=Solihabitans fulvus TaxID=1892852 RepID=A0A5B2WTK4_9PSEU|nr:glycosyltransferase [Solihabitans fulvus]KAA2254032.1 glycosyltransferase family 4 protein [Solihabitans fulvus]
MLGIAIACAVAAACCFAGAVHLQHSAVRAAASAGVLPFAALRGLLSSRVWRSGIALTVAGGGLHIVALSLAPLVIVQPIGVLSLVLTVLFARTTRGPGVLAAVLLCAGGVGAFVLLSAGSAADTATSPPQLGPAQLVAAAGLLLAAIGLATRGRARCPLLAVATAVLFGFGSALVRAAASGPGGPSPLPAVEAVAVLAVGGWLLHQAYASGPAAIVVAATTVVDPITAVGIGVGLYGESAAPTAGHLIGETVAGLAAVLGVLVLSRQNGTDEQKQPPRENDVMSTKPLRVVIGADTFPPDINGAARFAHRLAVGMAARGHDVHVICPSGDSRASTTTLDGVTVHRIGSMRTPFHPTFRVCPPWRAAGAVRSLFAELEPDVVHVQAHFLIGRFLARAARRGGVPLVATNHFMPENLLGYGPVPPVLRAPLSRWAWRDLARVYRSAVLVTAPTPRAVQLLRDNGMTGPTVAVSCGIDLDLFGPAANRQVGRPEPEVGRYSPSVLFVGRLDEEKNVHELLRAAARWPADLDARIELVGDGSQRAALTALAEELGIAHRVRLRGFVDEAELVEAYRRCAVFCMPGTAELQSLATMEAMAAGKPVVAADAMALPHLVQSGRNGWLYEPGDVDALSVRLAGLLRDSATRARMGAASREIVAGHDLDRTLDTFEDIYLDAVGVVRVGALPEAS